MKYNRFIWLYDKVKKGCLLSLCFTLLSCSKTKDKGSTSTEPITINGQVTILTASNYQVIKGFGCATVFNPPSTSPVTSQEFDRLFGTGNGQVGLNILRIRIASDNAWRATELAYAKEAIQRGGIILATPWSPPARMKTNNNIIGGALIPDSATSYATYLNDFANYMAANGAPVYAVSVQNEPDLNPSYEGCQWSSTEMKDFLKNQGHLITATRLMAPELVNYNTSYMNTILGDNTAVANLDLIGTHIYGGGIQENTTAKNLNKEVWMTEHLDTNVTYTANLNTAVEIHDCLTKAGFSAYIWWYGKRFYSAIGQDGLVTKRGYMMSQFARFIRSGSIRIGASSPTRSEVLISAYKNGTKKIIVAINTATFNVKQQFDLDSGTFGNLLPYTTSFTQDAQAGTSIPVGNNSFTYILPPSSVTTFIEQ